MTQVIIEYPGTGMIRYPFPLRNGVEAVVVLPRDVTLREVRRLVAMMEALAIDGGIDD